MERVMILGSGGSGKSTLARALGDRTGLPVIHLDQLYWKPGWVEPTIEEFREKHDAAMSGARWIIDGSYSRTFERRLAAADTIIMLDLPRRTCITGILRRWLCNRGGTRPDMAEGCPERMDWAFFKWVWDYPRRSRSKTLALLDSLRPSKTIHVLRSRREVRQWLEGVSEKTA